MADTTNVKGLDELQAFLDTLAPKVEANIMRGGLRAGMKVVLPVAQQEVHSVSGQLADGLKIGTRRAGNAVIAYMRAAGPHGFVARFVEYGTAAHVIGAKDGGWLSFGDGGFAKSVEHPGARAKPFMRPSLDSQAEAAVIATGEYVKDRLATKEGLDTSSITIEGDE